MYGKDFDIGVGVHWGSAVVGNIGAGESKDSQQLEIR